MSISRYNEPTHNYLDINIVNNNITSSNTTAPQPIVFSTSRNTDYLINPSDYYVSVIRWTMSMRLPIIIPQIQIPQTFNQHDNGGYRTVYSFCLTLDGKTQGDVPYNYTSGQVFINLISQQDFIPHPLAPITNLNDTYDNPFFYIDSIQYFLEGVNSALNTAWESLVNQWTVDFGLNTLPIPNQKPFIQYNYDGNMTLYASRGFLDNINPTIAGNSKASIFMNSSLYSLFNGFSAINQGYNSIINGMNNYLQIIDNGQTTNFNVLGTVYTYNYMITEYPVVQFWSPASSVVFTSLGIPVNPTNTAPTNVFGESPVVGSTSSNLDFQNIITDFNIDYTVGTEGRQVVSYAPSGEYRLFDLVGNRPLSQLNIQCYWKDKIIGGLHQMYLYSGGSATLKLMFRKKTFYLGQ